eukprot:SM000054S18142  [mRNA]  locus=s54:708299:708484:+ [translate_table: standard]
MTPESALKLLGVHEGCTFDEVLRAKRASQRSHASDHERVTEVGAPPWLPLRALVSALPWRI